MTKIDVLKAIIRVWSSEQNIDAVLAHLTTDIVWHVAAASKPPVHGHDGARQFLQEYRKKISSQNWRIFNYAETGDVLLLEGVDEITTVDDKQLIMPYAGILEFRGEQIKAWRDYYDPAATEACAIARANGEPIAEHIQMLIERPALPGLGA